MSFRRPGQCLPAKAEVSSRRIQVDATGRDAIVIDAIGQREVRGQEAVIGLAQPVMTTSDVLRAEREFPEIEGAPSLRPLQPLAFALSGKATSASRKAAMLTCVSFWQRSGS